ncbi:unnamed protein product [Dracunculus medinensis]|uniref:CPG4 domain-containing protein n=1 Tax=Dracunculus medinensis TaxID=318479 RepID=A0A0N4U1A4_DRAME|nr:unnamed protein product [Dracunculus medinensis]
MRSVAVVIFILPFVTLDETLNQKCRKLLLCSIKKDCVNLRYLVEKFNGAVINKRLYSDLDSSIDYGCIFTSGCSDECNNCPLCLTSKEQLVDVLSGTRRALNGECSTLVNCATDCVAQSNANFTTINYCLRHLCAFHCFDGSCNKCSAFVTRLFNQICVSAGFRRMVKQFDGQCYELFKQIVYSKFKEQFKRNGKQPAIGVHQHS